MPSGAVDFINARQIFQSDSPSCEAHRIVSDGPLCTVERGRRRRFDFLRPVLFLSLSRYCLIPAFWFWATGLLHRDRPQSRLLLHRSKRRSQPEFGKSRPAFLDVFVRPFRGLSANDQRQELDFCLLHTEKGRENPALRCSEHPVDTNTRRMVCLQSYRTLLLFGRR